MKIARVRKQGSKVRESSTGAPNLRDAEILGPTAAEVAELAVDLWKLGDRARADAASERVAAAYERAEDRLKRIGFEVDPMVNRPYDTNLKVRVVGHEPGEGPLVISQCISPAVYFRGRLVREAEIVTNGSNREE